MNSTSKPILRTAAVVVSVVTLAAACGSSSKTAATSDTAPSSAAAALDGAGPHRQRHQDRRHRLRDGLPGEQQRPVRDRGAGLGRLREQDIGWDQRPPGAGVPRGRRGDPATAQSAEKKLVDTDKVQAIVVGSDNLVTAFDADALSKGVPLVSGTANATDWYTKPGMFVTVTDVLSGLTDQVLVAKQFGHATKFADLYCAEVAACAQANPPLQAAAKKAGLGFTSLAISSTATSYTAECLKLQQEKVDYAQLNFTTAAAAKLVQDCQAQNYNPTWGTSEQAVGKDLLSIPNFNAYGPAYAFPSSASSPAVAAFTKAMTTYAKGDNWKEGVASFTWTGLEAIRAALANAGTTVTSADITGGAERAEVRQPRRPGGQPADVHHRQAGELRSPPLLLRRRRQGWQDHRPQRSEHGLRFVTRLTAPTSEAGSAVHCPPPSHPRPSIR